jgi:Putative zinc finger motif, C2HC5-type
LCTSCGFILCVVNLPHFACPSCSQALLTPSDRTGLIARFESELASTLAREAEARKQAEKEAQKAAGAFPVLSVSGMASSLTPPPIAVPEAHKVLSLNSKTKKVIVSSYLPGSSRPASRGLYEAEAEDEVVHVLRPSGADVVYAKGFVSKERPWENLRGEGATYVPPARVDSGPQEKTEGGQGSRKRRGKGKTTAPEKGNEGPDTTTLS